MGHIIGFVRRDSQTALTLASEGRFRSSNVRNSAVAMTMIGATRNFNVRGAHHVLKEDNQAWKGQGETWSSLVGRIVSQTVDVGLVDGPS